MASEMTSTVYFPSSPDESFGPVSPQQEQNKILKDHFERTTAIFKELIDSSSDEFIESLDLSTKYSELKQMEDRYNELQEIRNKRHAEVIEKIKNLRFEVSASSNRAQTVDSDS